MRMKLGQRQADINENQITNDQVLQVLNSHFADGDIDKAVELLILYQQSSDGIVRPYDPNVIMLGAINRNGVTCYLDSLLFAMFARLGSFEHILHAVPVDEKKRALATIIRLWVNMLRSGMLIHTDIVSGYTIVHTYMLMGV